MRAINERCEEEEDDEEEEEDDDDDDEEAEEKMRASFPDITIKVSFLVNRKAISDQRAES